MYEGINDIFRLLDAGRLKEALTQLQAISAQTNQWSLQNRIETALTAYGYMLQYAGQGMEDPNREEFYRQTLRTAYELTDEVNIALLARKTSAVYYDRIRTWALHPAKSYAEIQLQLEAYTEDATTAPLLYSHPDKLQAEMTQIAQTHEAALTELFDKTWTTPFWTETEASEAGALLQSILVGTNDLAVMVSAITLSLLRVFDARKFQFLLEAYRHEHLQVNQRALVGIVIALSKHAERITRYPHLLNRLSLLKDDAGFCRNLHTIQMQLLLTRETSKIDKKMREEIIPEMIKNAKQMNNPKFRFDESEDPEDRNPEWEEWMDKSGMSDKIREMGEWQMAGADIYMSSFAQLKHYPFFHQLSHWFYPFDVNQPMFTSLQKELGEGAFTPLKLIVHSDNFCNSDKYSFCLAMLSMSKQMKDASMRQMEEQVRMSEEQKDRLEALMHPKLEAKSVSRLYIQDLYRFFKLWKNHQEEEDIFRWKFDLWNHPLLKDALLQEETTKELADYLLQKEYWEEAYLLYQRLMQMSGSGAEIYQKAGFIRQRQKRYAEAIEHYRHADLLVAEQHWTNKHLAQCYKLSGQYPQALEYFRKVEAVHPENLNIALQIGQCLVNMQNYTEALGYFYKVEYLEKKPDNARRAIAWCSFLTGKYEEALKYYDLLLNQSSPKAEDWMNAGHVHLVNNRMQMAIRHYQQVARFYQSHSDFVEHFNEDRAVLMEKGLSAEAIQILLDLLVSP